MNDIELSNLFAESGEAREPALPPEYAEQTLARARRSVRARRGVGAVAAVMAIVLVLLLLPWAGRLHQANPPADPPGRPTMPERFADYSALTSHAADRPGGRAIALYEYGSSELFTSWQTLVVGADRDTYRRIERDNGEVPAVLLSPDGTRLLYYEAKKGTDEFTLFDLATAQTRVLHSVEWVSNVAGIDLLAWSPDGRYVAYAVPAPPPADGTAASSYVDGRPIKELAILDVVNDTTVRYPQISPIVAVAFAPDSRRLAVEMGTVSWIVSVQGERLQPWDLPAGSNLASNAAWSPDGALIATIVAPVQRPDGLTTSEDARIRFVDASGTGRSVPPDLPYFTMLGWRSATSVLVPDWLPEGEVVGIVEVSVNGGHRSVLSTFSGRDNCEYGMQTCQAYRIQLATALLDSIGTRPSDPDRGPWVGAIRAAMVLQLILAGGFVLWLIRRSRWRRKASAGMSRPR